MPAEIEEKQHKSSIKEKVNFILEDLKGGTHPNLSEIKEIGALLKAKDKAKELYYKKFEDRVPYSYLKPALWTTLMFQFFALLFIGIGGTYIFWRWSASLNFEALWFSLPLVIAETLMYVSSVLMIVNNWEIKTIPKSQPVHLLSEIEPDVLPENDRPLKIDLFIATYNEEYGIIEDTIKDAKQVRYPFDDVAINIYLCDDGRRDGSNSGKENFKKLAEKYGINYLIRPNNKGYKAGNLNNAFWQTDGDLIVILDADTRAFPDFLINMTGYFRDPKMAWVQSPQWFYDIDEGENLKSLLCKKKFFLGKVFASIIPFSKKIVVGKDLLGTDPKIFYGVVLRKRNAANAAFCCGAGSIHRRKALEQLIVNNSKRLKKLGSELPFNPEKIRNPDLIKYLDSEYTIIGPFVHHISEDIYTSVLMHADKNKWKSYQHPDVECKMLSPQTLQTFHKQFSRYAEGTYDLFLKKDNPIIKRGLTLRQRLAYSETFFSYFSAFWIVVFLFCPIVFYFSLVPPINAFNFDFFIRFIALCIVNQFIMVLGNWGISTKRSEQYFIGGFWLKLTALFNIVTGKKLVFNTTAKLGERSDLFINLKLVWPHLLITLLTVVGFIYNLVLVINNTHPSYSAFFANTVWAFYNIYQMNPIIRNAFKIKTV